MVFAVTLLALVIAWSYLGKVACRMEAEARKDARNVCDRD